MSGETEQQVSGWTTDTLRVYVQSQLDSMSAMLQERYETQTKAVDAAFLAQQTAMQTALTAAERAVQTALLAAEKAVNKAEIAADKRFEATNEFRAQLNDQVATFPSRIEVDARITSLAEKLDTETVRTTERINQIERRLDTSEGHDAGLARKSDATGVGISQLISALGVLLVFISVAATIIIATR